MCAAALTLEQMEASWDSDNPATSIGERDALSLMLLSAVRNTYRGAYVVLGSGSEAIKTFERRLPDIKTLRDRVEHFEDYVRGAGWAQTRGGGSQVNEDGDGVGFEIVSSTGGGAGGHSLHLRVREGSSVRNFTLDTRPAVGAARAIARTTISVAGLSSDEHDRRCRHCSVKLEDPRSN